MPTLPVSSADRNFVGLDRYVFQDVFAELPLTAARGKVQYLEFQGSSTNTNTTTSGTEAVAMTVHFPLGDKLHVSKAACSQQLVNAYVEGTNTTLCFYNQQRATRFRLVVGNLRGPRTPWSYVAQGFWNSTNGTHVHGEFLQLPMQTNLILRATIFNESNPYRPPLGYVYENVSCTMDVPQPVQPGLLCHKSRSSGHLYTLQLKHESGGQEDATVLSGVPADGSSLHLIPSQDTMLVWPSNNRVVGDVTLVQWWKTQGIEIPGIDATSDDIRVSYTNNFSSSSPGNTFVSATLIINQSNTLVFFSTDQCDPCLGELHQPQVTATTQCTQCAFDTERGNYLRATVNQLGGENPMSVGVYTYDRGLDNSATMLPGRDYLKIGRWHTMLQYLTQRATIQSLAPDFKFSSVRQSLELYATCPTPRSAGTSQGLKLCNGVTEAPGGNGLPSEPFFTEIYLTDKATLATRTNIDPATITPAPAAGFPLLYLEAASGGLSDVAAPVIGFYDWINTQKWDSTALPTEPAIAKNLSWVAKTLTLRVQQDAVFFDITPCTSLPCADTSCSYCFYRKCQGQFLDLSVTPSSNGGEGAELKIQWEGNTGRSTWGELYNATLLSSQTADTLPYGLPPLPSHVMLLARLMMKKNNDPGAQNFDLSGLYEAASCAHAPVTINTDHVEPLQLCYKDSSTDHFYTMIVHPDTVGTEVHQVAMNYPYHQVSSTSKAKLKLNLVDVWAPPQQDGGGQQRQGGVYGVEGWKELITDLGSSLPGSIVSTMLAKVPGSTNRDLCVSAQATTTEVHDGGGGRVTTHVSRNNVTLNLFGTTFSTEECSLVQMQKEYTCIIKVVGPGFLQCNYTLGHLSFQQNTEEMHHHATPIIGDLEVMEDYVHHYANITAVQNQQIYPWWFNTTEPQNPRKVTKTLLPNGPGWERGDVCKDTTIKKMATEDYYVFCANETNGDEYVMIVEENQTFGFPSVSGSAPQIYNTSLYLLNNSHQGSIIVDTDHFRRRFLKRLLNLRQSQVAQQYHPPEYPGEMVIPNSTGILPSDLNETNAAYMVWRLTDESPLMFRSTAACKKQSLKANCPKLEPINGSGLSNAAGGGGDESLREQVLWFHKNMTAESVQYSAPGFFPGFMRLGTRLSFSDFKFDGSQEEQKDRLVELLHERGSELCTIAKINTCSPVCIVLDKTPQVFDPFSVDQPPPTGQPYKVSSRSFDVQQTVGHDLGDEHTLNVCAQKATKYARYFFFFQLYGYPVATIHDIDHFKLDSSTDTCIEAEAVRAWTSSPHPEFELRCQPNPEYIVDKQQQDSDGRDEGRYSSLTYVTFTYKGAEYPFYVFGGVGHMRREYLGGLELRCGPCLPILAEHFHPSPWIFIVSGAFKNVFDIALWFFVSWKCKCLIVCCLAPLVSFFYTLVFAPVRAKEDVEDLRARMLVPYVKVRLNMAEVEERLAKAVNLTEEEKEKNPKWESKMPDLTSSDIQCECAEHFIEELSHGEKVMLRLNLSGFGIRCHLRAYYKTFNYVLEEDYYGSFERWDTHLAFGTQRSIVASGRMSTGPLGDSLLFHTTEENTLDDPSAPAFATAGPPTAAELRQPPVLDSRDEGPTDAETDGRVESSPVLVDRNLARGGRGGGGGGSGGYGSTSPPSAASTPVERSSGINATPGRSPSPPQQESSRKRKRELLNVAEYNEKVVKVRGECVEEIRKIMKKEEKTWEPLLLNKDVAKAALRPLQFYLAIDAFYLLAQLVFSAVELIWLMDLRQFGHFEIYELFYFRIINSTTIGALTVNSAARISMMTDAQVAGAKKQLGYDYTKHVGRWETLGRQLRYVAQESPFIIYSIVVALPPIVTHILPGVFVYWWFTLLLTIIVVTAWSLQKGLLEVVQSRHKKHLKRQAAANKTKGDTRFILGEFFSIAAWRLVLYVVVCGGASCYFNWMVNFYMYPPLEIAARQQKGFLSGPFLEAYFEPVIRDHLSRSFDCFMYMFTKSIAAALQVTIQLPFFFI